MMLTGAVILRVVVTVLSFTQLLLYPPSRMILAGSVMALYKV